VRLDLRPASTFPTSLGWTDGTTHLIFEPVELLERLAALIPRPRINLVLYHGVLAPRAAWRARVVPPRVETAADGTEPSAAVRIAPDRPIARGLI
jgi:hypothetical protein